jgi:nucleotidyltransferase substrate binding protein (TIGR01987 family)
VAVSPKPLLSEISNLEIWISVSSADCETLRGRSVGRRNERKWKTGNQKCGISAALTSAPRARYLPHTMTEKRLDLSPLRMALASLELALAQPKNEFIRDSVIQRFEYIYELSWNRLKRHLEEDEGVASIDQLTRKQLFRVAVEKGLIGGIEEWFADHRARNDTAHAYNEAVAEEVYDAARRFAPDARTLLDELERRANA